MSEAKRRGRLSSRWGEVSEPPLAMVPVRVLGKKKTANGFLLGQQVQSAQPVVKWHCTQGEGIKSMRGMRECDALYMHTHTHIYVV